MDKIKLFYKCEIPCDYFIGHFVGKFMFREGIITSFANVEIKIHESFLINLTFQMGGNSEYYTKIAAMIFDLY